MPFQSLLCALAVAPHPVPVNLAALGAIEPATLAEDAPPALNEWTGSVALGATFASGNTEKQTANATAHAEYRREKDRWTLGALWNFSDEAIEEAPPDDDNSLVKRRLYGSGKYDYFLSKKTYLLGQAGAEHDSEANLDLRATAGVGVGYQFKEDADLKVLGELGLSYVDEDYEDPASPAPSADAEFLAARVAYKVDWKPAEKWTVGHSGELFPSLEDSDDVFGKLDTTVRLNLTEKMFAQLQWIFTWDNTPAYDDPVPPALVGERKERVDNLVTLGIGWSF